MLGIAPGAARAGRDQGPGRRHRPRAGQRARRDPEDGRCSTPPTWAAELTWAALERSTSGANLFNARGLRALHASPRTSDKWDGCATKNYVGIAMAFTPTWYQVFPGVDLSAAGELLASACRGNSPLVFGGNQGLGNYSVGLGVDVFQKYRFDLKYSDYIGALQGQRHERHEHQRLHHLPGRPGHHRPDLQDHLLTQETNMHMPTQTAAEPDRGLRRRPDDRRRPRRRHRRRSQGARHHAHADRRREGRQQGRHHSRLHRRPDDAAGRLQGRRRHPPEPVRRRQAAPDGRRQEHGAARRQADRGHQGAAAEVPDLPRRRLPDAAQRRLPEMGRRQHAEDRDARRRPTTTAARSRARTPASRSRSRRTATRRCGTTWCASMARPTRRSTAT